MGNQALEFTADQVKIMRNKHNLTQAQFAEGLGVTRQAINNYETGYRNPPKAMVMHMISVYGGKPKSRASNKNN